MSFIFSTPVLIRHLWQLKKVVFLHWFLICALLLLRSFARKALTLKTTSVRTVQKPSGLSSAPPRSAPTPSANVIKLCLFVADAHGK